MDVLEFRGLKLPNNPDILGGRILRRIMRDGYERHEINAALAMLEPGARVLDIGAGIGLTGAVVATAGKAEAVLSVEGNPELRSQIEGTHALNGIENVEVVTGILGHEGSGSVDFYLRPEFWSSSMDGERPYREVASVARHDVNEIMAAFRPTFIMCDIEGGEIDLFTPDLDLEGVQGIVMELHPDRTPQTGIHTLFKALIDKGFCYSCDHSHRNVVAFQQVF